MMVSELSSDNLHDAGPSPNTAMFLDTLDKYGMKATFFLIGLNILSDPAAVQEIINRGHQVGSHTYSHQNMSLFTYEQVYTELTLWETIFLSLNLTGPPAGMVPSYLRARGGAFSDTCQKAASDLGYTSYYWSFDSGDSASNVSSTDILDGLKSHFSDMNAVDVSKLSVIYQAHDRVNVTAAAWPQMAEYLATTLKGVKFVTLEECMGVPAYRPQPSRKAPTDLQCQSGIMDLRRDVCCPLDCPNSQWYVIWDVDNCLTE